MSQQFAQLSQDERKQEEREYEASDTLIQTELTVKRSLKKLRFFIVGAFILSVTALLGAGFLYQSLNAEKRQRTAYEAAQSELNEKSNVLLNQVSKYKTVIGGLRGQISEYSTERKQFKRELDRNNIEIENLRKKMLALEDQKRSLSKRAAKASAQAKESATQLAKKTVETNLLLAGVDQPLLGLEAAEVSSGRDKGGLVKSALSSSAVETVAASDASAQESVVKTAQGTASAIPAVLSVNRKYSFVVVNVGRREGVKIGDTFHAFRDNKRIATLEVEKLYDHFVAAKIVKEVTRGEIAQGDEVRKVS